MKHGQVNVDFGQQGTFEFRVAADAVAKIDRDQAIAWFDREFVTLECDVSRPTGKVLSIDRVLSIARYSGAKRFESDPAFGEQYALHTLALLRRELVNVDVARDTVGS